jgi:flavin-dependent dehydrogenase
MANADAAARLGATIDVPDAAARTWDVLVIGAGPGGAFAAREAARTGLATLLVERSSFPRAKVCGGCLNHTAVGTLERAGLGDRLARLGGPAITTVRLRQDRRQAPIPMPSGVAVSRRALDAMLVVAAIEAGTQFLPETTAVIAREPAKAAPAGHRLVGLDSRGQPAVQVEARVVIAAGGLAQTSLRACGEFESVVSRDSRIGVGTVGPAGALALPPGTITMVVGQAGYVGAVIVEEGRIHVAAALDPHFIRQCGSPGRGVASVLEGADVPVGDAFDSLDWLGTLPLTRRTLRPVGRRVLLVGDASGYVEPFTGEGMAWALAMASVTTPFILRGLRAWDEPLEREWIATRDALTGRQRRTCRMIARALRAPWAVRGVIELLARWPSLAHPIVSRLGAGLGARPCTKTGGV